MGDFWVVKVVYNAEDPFDGGAGASRRRWFCGSGPVGERRSDFFRSFVPTGSVEAAAIQLHDFRRTQILVLAIMDDYDFLDEDLVLESRNGARVARGQRGQSVRPLVSGARGHGHAGGGHRQGDLRSLHQGMESRENLPAEHPHG